MELGTQSHIKITCGKKIKKTQNEGFQVTQYDGIWSVWQGMTEQTET